MKTLNLCYKTQFLERNTCQFTKSPYLCIVFFIVLDFKVNKGWSTAVLLFLCLQFRLSRKKLKKKFSKICEYRCPDGGIGRRAGLKHQWSNIHPGSTPGLGTKKSAKHVFMFSRFFFIISQNFLGLTQINAISLRLKNSIGICTRKSSLPCCLL